MGSYISIDKTNKYEPIDLLKIHMDTYIDLRYNKATMGGEALKRRAPGNNRRYYMAVSDAQRRAANKYISEKLEEIKFRVPKGKKDIIKAHAESRGESVNSFINRAVDETIERDGEDK